MRHWRLMDVGVPFLSLLTAIGPLVSSALGNPERCDVVCLGKLEGRVEKDGKVVVDDYRKLGLEEATKRLDSRKMVERDGSSKVLHGFVYRMTIQHVLKGNVKSGSVDVFWRADSVDLPLGTSGMFCLNERAFDTGRGLVFPHPKEGCALCQELPQGCLQKGYLSGLEEGKNGLMTLYRRMLADADSDISTIGALGLAHYGDGSSLGLMRKRLAEQFKATGGDAKRNLLIVKYVKALLILEDIPTLISSSEWLSTHPEVVRLVEKWSWFPNSENFDTPFEGQKQLVILALKKLSDCDLPWLKKEAASVLGRLAQGQKADLPTIEIRTEQERKQEKRMVFKDLVAIHDAKIRWFKTSTNATVVTAEDLSRLIDGGFPKPPKGGCYEIGAKDEFPYYVPPLPPDDWGQESKGDK